MRGRVLDSKNKEWLAAVANMALPFLSFLHSSVAAFLLVSQTFAPRLTTSRHFSLFCNRYSRQLGAMPKYLMESFSVSLKSVFFYLALKALAVEQFLRESVTFHADNITGPTKLWLHQDRVDARLEKSE